MFHVLKDSPWHAGIFTEKVMEYAPTAKAFAKSFKDEARKVIEKYSTIETFKERFATDSKATFTFESASESCPGWINVTEHVISRHEDGSPAMISIAFNKADADAIRTAELQKNLKSYADIIGGLAQEFDALHIITLDEDEFIPYVQNSGYEDDLVKLSAPGVSWRDALIASLTPMVHPDNLDEVLRYSDKEYIRGLLKNRRRHSLRIRLKKTLNGTSFYWSEMVIIKLDPSDEDTTRIAMGFIDVDDQVRKEREQQEELAEALLQAQSSNRAKTIFLNNMSHDIRTPMNAIIGYSGLAMSDIGNKDKVLDYLGKIRQSSEHLLSLINDVLDMSRIESGNICVVQREESLSGIITNLCDIIHIQAEAKQQSFTVDSENVIDDHIICDRVRLMQVLLNILSNAVKYTPPQGSISFSIKEKQPSASGHATFEFIVTDTGIGMNEAELKSVFEPFSRAKSSTVSGIQGTGLGMTIAKSLVEMMDGRIEVRSEEGVGTEVRITIDFRLAEAPATSSVTGEAQEDVDIKGMKILLVEDNMLNMEIATAVLQEFGCEVFPAEDGTVAVEKMRLAEEGGYDIILMDIQMPGMDGYEATRRIRSLGTAASRTPIIAMTANAFEEDRRAAIEAGMDDHLTKPFDTDLLKKTLAKYYRSASFTKSR